MRAVLLIGAIVAAYVPASPATAITPRGPPEVEQACKAIAELDPFVGTWRSEVTHPGGGWYRIYRRVVRGENCVLLVSNANAGQGPVDFVVFDSTKQHLLMVFPGYRSGGEAVEQVKVSKPDPLTLQWTAHNGVAMNRQSSIRTTVRLVGREWRESQEYILPDGRVLAIPETVFVRAGDARLVFEPPVP